MTLLGEVQLAARAVCAEKAPPAEDAHDGSSPSWYGKAWPVRGVVPLWSIMVGLATAETVKARTVMVTVALSGVR